MSETRAPQQINFTEVTLRDGEQQAKAHPIMPIDDRIRVFDRIVDTGIQRVEVGHLGNPHDIEFAETLTDHIIRKTEDGDSRYEQVELQVLLGSQVDLTRGVNALTGFDPERVVVHIYDRVSPNLRHLAKQPYSIEESADRVTGAAMSVIDQGYRNISISGEGTVDTDVGVQEATDRFYGPVIDRIKTAGAGSVNVNVPNTFGAPMEGEWSEVGLRYFNDRIKRVFPDVTTSFHVHNDGNQASSAAMTAIRAGFDTIEGTMTGMGERSGNVALVDVMTALLDNARTFAETRNRGNQMSDIARLAIVESMWNRRIIAPSVVAGLQRWFRTAQSISNIYGTENRFAQTSLGNVEAYSAGAGPHAQANQEALVDPVGKPLWRNYGRIALVHDMMGRPEADKIITIDPDYYRAITLDTHAAGGSTRRVLAGEVAECNEDERHEAIAMARGAQADIIAVVSGGTSEPPEQILRTLR